MIGSLVLNHHSLPYDSVHAAMVGLPSFIKMALLTRNHGIRMVVMEREWYRLELCPKFSFIDWRKQYGAEHRDLADALLGMATLVPLFGADEVGGELELFEVKLSSGSDNLDALRAAVWYVAPLLSFATRPPWLSNPLQALKVTVSGDDLVEESLQVANVYDEPTLREVFPSEQRQRKLGARDLGRRWKELFPDLELCGQAESQLRLWAHGLDMLDHVASALDKLQIVANQWKRGTVVGYQHEPLRQLGIRVTDESESCGKNPRTRAARTFTTAHGDREYFEAHIKLAEEFRIHFFPDARTKEIHVGYIGPHLPLP